MECHKEQEEDSKIGHLHMINKVVDSVSVTYKEALKKYRKTIGTLKLHELDEQFDKDSDSSFDNDFNLNKPNNVDYLLDKVDIAGELKEYGEIFNRGGVKKDLHQNFIEGICPNVPYLRDIVGSLISLYEKKEGDTIQKEIEQEEVGLIKSLTEYDPKIHQSASLCVPNNSTQEASVVNDQEQIKS